MIQIIINMEHKLEFITVDDDRITLLALEELITSMGYKHNYAETGSQCLDLLKAINADLIIMDIRLGNESGIDLCRQIKALDISPLPIVILFTGKSMTDEVFVEGLNAGADGYITKSMERSELKFQLQLYARLKISENKLHSKNVQLERINNHLDLKNYLMEYLSENRSPAIIPETLTRMLTKNRCYFGLYYQ